MDILFWSVMVFEYNMARFILLPAKQPSQRKIRNTGNNSLYIINPGIFKFEIVTLFDPQPQLCRSFYLGMVPHTYILDPVLSP